MAKPGTTAQVDTVVAISFGPGEPTFATLRFPVPWDITIEQYNNQIRALVLAMTGSVPDSAPPTDPSKQAFPHLQSPPGPLPEGEIPPHHDLPPIDLVTLPGGGKADYTVVDMFQRIIPIGGNDNET
jgi:hypothetical protein